MHIGLNLVYLVPGAQGGMETYARELIPELVAAAPQHTFTSFINRDAAAAGGPWCEQTGSVVVGVSARSRAQWVRGEQQLLPRLAQRAGVGLLHSFASTSPAWGRFTRVTTIHDLNYRAMPDAHPGLRTWGMRVLVPLAARSSTRVIAPSVVTANDLAAHLRIDRDRVDVVPEGLGTTSKTVPSSVGELRAQLRAGDRQIVLSPSAKLPHKNLPRLIDALALMRTPTRPLLVLPGYPTRHEIELRDRVHAQDLDDDVRFVGWVPAADLEGLYRTATCVVFPTLAEGFGLPVLEAMARGTAVACSDIPVLQEVCGDAALRFDPRSPPSIAEALRRLGDDEPLRHRLVAAGLARAHRFSWAAAATGTLASYELAVRSRS